MRTVRVPGAVDQQLLVLRFMVESMTVLSTFELDEMLYSAAQSFEGNAEFLPHFKDSSGAQLDGQRTVTGSSDILPQLLLVRGEDAGTATAAGDRDIPLLGARRSLDR